MFCLIFLGCSIVCCVRPIRGLFAFLIGGQTMDPFKIRETNKLLNLEHSHCKQLFCWYLEKKSLINLRTFFEREKTGLGSFIEALSSMGLTDAKKSN